MIARTGLLVFIGLAFGACVQKGPASIMGGECKIFEPPPFEVAGKRPYDQDWIDSNIEGGVGGCNWKRPAPRPAELDTPAPAAAPVVKKKRSLAGRLKDRAKSVWTRPAPASAAVVQPVPDQVTVPPVEEAPQPPPAASVVTEQPSSPQNPRCDAVDALLHPADCGRR